MYKMISKTVGPCVFFKKAKMDKLPSAQVFIYIGLHVKRKVAQTFAHSKTGKNYR